MIFRKDLPIDYSYHQTDAASESRLTLMANADTQELLVNIAAEPNDLSHLSITHPLTVEAARSLRDYLSTILND